MEKDRGRELILAPETYTNFYIEGTRTLKFYSSIGENGKWLVSVSGLLICNEGSFEVKFDKNINPKSPGGIPVGLLEEIIRKTKEIKSAKKPLTVTIYDGDDIYEASRKMIGFAETIGKPVQTEFNGITLKVKADDTEKTVNKRYRAGQGAAYLSSFSSVKLGK